MTFRNLLNLCIRGPPQRAPHSGRAPSFFYINAKIPVISYFAACKLLSPEDKMRELFMARSGPRLGNLEFF
jgi:hypothetical protein